MENIDQENSTLAAALSKFHELPKKGYGEGVSFAELKPLIDPVRFMPSELVIGFSGSL